MRPNNNAVDEFDTEYRGAEIIRTKFNKPIYVRTAGQERLVEAIRNNDIIFVNGPSGTGKTALATWVGIAGIDAGIYERLVLTRPVVTSGEELGFLPGTMDEKVAPYMQPLYDAISLIKGGRDDKPIESDMPMLTAKEKKKIRAEKKEEESKPRKSFYDLVQVCPLAYIRGSTLARSFIVCDEFQNVTCSQMKTMLTRLGRGSKMVICGDSEQCDLPGNVKSGFTDAFNLLKGIKRIAFVELGVDDIVRHRLIKSIILRYERPDYEEAVTATDEAKNYAKKTRSPGWHEDLDDIDFDPIDDDSELDVAEDGDGELDVIDDGDEMSDIDLANAEFAKSWKKERSFS